MQFSELDKLIYYLYHGISSSSLCICLWLECQFSESRYLSALIATVCGA